MVPEIIIALDKAEVRISSINISSPTLDDVFLKHTGRRIRTEGQQSESSTIEMKRKKGFSFRRRQEAV